MRFIDDGWRTGAENMARDEALSIAVASGDSKPVMRVYRFEPPCITIGRFQEYPAWFDLSACKELGLEVVRRPTGGMAILHLEDFTYSVCFSRDTRFGRSREQVFSSVGEGILSSLRILGIRAELAAHNRGPSGRSPWCFESAFGVDIEFGGRKICGSAQKQSASCVLQHGSMFLRPCDDTLRRVAGETEADGHAPMRGRRLISISEAAGRRVSWEELREAVIQGFEGGLGETLEEGKMTRLEKGIACRLLEDKYGTAGWLEKASGG